MKLPRLLLDVARNCFRDGFIHAGNLAYLSLVTLFPLFILLAAVGGAFGRTEAGAAALEAFFQAVPPDVATLLGPAIEGVIGGKSGGLLTLGALVALWTVSTFVETLRDLMARPWGVPPARPPWQTRLLSMGAVLLAVLLMLLAFASQIILTAALQFVLRLLPMADSVAGWLGLSRLVPPVILFLALWALFELLTPRKFRHHASWPGAVATTLVWVGATALMPWLLTSFGGYSLTYGALSGVMVALLFFYVVGFGFVVGAELNAALAQRHDAALRAVVERSAHERIDGGQARAGDGGGE
ncbi:YihY/virulence factor BrkB family protein [Sandaracinobacteroides saxicola]|uniref:YihY/virulence factor BrkB family protein n=1 Tax=Sandaracinobacteroides saxicola TaxID=2759707 RepID=A0A7G5IFB2_9SPHN|nr:YihY/virulence factor BrkB family protein [Sandaracinobacteroides saxicola]QMW22054.1 YihY/virulence factor BrkB family protein [Sandaracinobacteroides saxicola]